MNRATSSLETFCLRHCS